MENTNNFFGSINQYGNHNNIIKNEIKDANEQSQSKEGDSLWKNNVEEFLANGKIKEALHEIVRNSNDELTRKQIIQLSGRISKMEIDLVAGTMNKQDEVLETNSIRNAVQLILQGI
jgi:hypothetical protein